MNNNDLKNNKNIALHTTDDKTGVVIREAIHREELSRPPMPTDLNARLMQRMEKDVNAKPQAKRKRIIWPWIAAACVAAMIAVYIAPPQVPQQVPQPPKGKSLIAHADRDSATSAKPVNAVKPEMPETPEYPDNPKTPAKPKLPATPANTAPPSLPSVPAQNDLAMADNAATPAATSTATSAAPAAASLASSTANTSASASASPASSTAKPSVLAATGSSASPTAQPRILSERDIPITRPENLKYTKEELALMKRQANEAYIKWIQLELEIAKYNQEQMAQK